MKNNTSYLIGFSILLAGLLASCSGSSRITDADGVRSKIYSGKNRNAILKSDSIVATLDAKLKETVDLLAENRERTAANVATGTRLGQAVNAMGNGQVKDELSATAADLGARLHAGDAVSLEIEERMAPVWRLLTPQGQDALRDSLITVAIEQAYTRKGKRRLSDSEEEKVASDVAEQVTRVLDEAIKEHIAANEQLRLLLARENTILYEMKVLTANLRVSKAFWRLNTRTYFASGQDVLSPTGHASLQRDVRQATDSMILRLRQVLPDLMDPLHKGPFPLNVYVDGYADSQNHRGRSTAESVELDRALSQRRAELILEFVAREVELRLKQAKLPMEVVVSVFSAKGHGRELPDPVSTYAPHGRSDQVRRVATQTMTLGTPPLAQPAVIRPDGL